MNRFKRVMCCLAAVMAVPMLFAAEPTISITATPRYPWNGKVDLKFTIDGTSGSKYYTSFTAKDVAGGTNLVMKTLYKSDGTAANISKEQLLPGTYNWVWNTTADLGEGVCLNRVAIEGSVRASYSFDRQYVAFDLISGETEEFDSQPEHGWADEYKTSKLLFRRIEAGKYYIGQSKFNSVSNKYYAYRAIELSDSYYVGVFEITQRQWELIMGDRPSYFTNEQYYAMRPVERVSYERIRGTGFGLSMGEGSKDGFLGRLRANLGCRMVDLPTVTQWEVACRAGVRNDFYNGTTMSRDIDDFINVMAKCDSYNMNVPCRCYSNSRATDGWDMAADITTGTAIVGSYAPNNWGLYDMVGNVAELCRDNDAPYTGVDPIGDMDDKHSTCMGGGYNYLNAIYYTSFNRSKVDVGFPSVGVGFRVVLGRCE